MCNTSESKLYLLDFSYDDDNKQFSFEDLKLFSYKDIVLLSKINGIETNYMIKRNGKNVYTPKNINMLILDLIKIIKKYDNNDNINDFEKEIKNKQEKLLKNIDNRANAFKILSNKKEIGKKLVKTKLCNSVAQNAKCKHGEKCRFAHDKKELISCNCLFGKNCIYIYKKDDKYFNKLKTKICEHKHPLETNDNYNSRIYNHL